jgi:hypothetical protein
MLHAQSISHSFLLRSSIWKRYKLCIILSPRPSNVKSVSCVTDQSNVSPYSMRAKSLESRVKYVKSKIPFSRMRTISLHFCFCCEYSAGINIGAESSNSVFSTSLWCNSSFRLAPLVLKPKSCKAFHGIRSRTLRFVGPGDVTEPLGQWSESAQHVTYCGLSAHWKLKSVLEMETQTNLIHVFVVTFFHASWRP